MENYDDIIYRRVGFGPRFGAAFIDGIILFAIGYGLKMALGIQDPDPAELMGDDPANVDMGNIMLVSMKASLAQYILAILYTTMEIFLRKTPGKMALGLIIAGENMDTPTTNGLVMRYLFKQSSYFFFLLAIFLNTAALIWVGFLVALVYVIGCFFTLGESRMGLHDKIGKTAVYKEKELAELQQA